MKYLKIIKSGYNNFEKVSGIRTTAGRKIEKGIKGAMSELRKEENLKIS